MPSDGKRADKGEADGDRASAPARSRSIDPGRANRKGTRLRDVEVLRRRRHHGPSPRRRDPGDERAADDPTRDRRSEGGPSRSKRRGRKFLLPARGPGRQVVSEIRPRRSLPGYLPQSQAGVQEAACAGLLVVAARARPARWDGLSTKRALGRQLPLACNVGREPDADMPPMAIAIVIARSGAADAGPVQVQPGNRAREVGQVLRESPRATGPEHEVEMSRRGQAPAAKRRSEVASSVVNLELGDDLNARIRAGCPDRRQQFRTRRSKFTCQRKSRHLGARERSSAPRRPYDRTPRREMPDDRNGERWRGVGAEGLPILSRRRRTATVM